MNQFQFKLSDLVVFTGYSAVAAWLISLGLWWLVPLLVAFLIVYTSGMKSGYPLAAAAFGGLAFGLGLVITCLTTYYTFFHPLRGALVRFQQVFSGLTVIVWLVTLILFFQFRKLIREFHNKVSIISEHSN